jgi:hypothetical protein
MSKAILSTPVRTLFGLTLSGLGGLAVAGRDDFLRHSRKSTCPKCRNHPRPVIVMETETTLSNNPLNQILS